MNVIHVVVADDSALIRDGVTRLLADEGFEVVAQAGTLDALMAAVVAAKPNLVITDIRMPPTFSDEGLVAARRIRDECGDGIGVLVLSQHLEVEFAMRLLQDGGRGMGYVLKDRITDIGDFIDAARRVARGGSVVDPAIVAALLALRQGAGPLDTLTGREREVLGLMAEGRSNAGIAERLFLTEKTIEGYVGDILGKLGIEPAADDHRRVLAVLAHLRHR